MRKFMFLAVLVLLGSFLLTGCKGKESAGAKEGVSTEKKAEETSEEENLLLTEKDVVAFIKAFPVFVDITKKKEKEIEPLTDKENLISGMKMAGEFEQYAKELDAALDDYGFTFETFSSTYAKVMGAFAYGKMIESSKGQMEQMLNNPNIPEEQKEEIRKSLKEMEESEEMKAAKENWKIVEKHEEELIEILKDYEKA